MRSREDVESLLLRETAPAERMRSFASLLASESGLGVHGMVVVGGSAIEIYTGGAYVSGDIDLLVTDRGRVEPVLRRWGFRDEGKLWTHAPLGLFVDLMQRENSGSQRLTRVLDAPYGPIRLGAVEDLVLKRLREARYWSQREALAQAILLLSAVGQDLDWKYVEFFAKREALEDLVAEARARSR